MQSNLARTTFIAVLAAGLFGLFLLVTPKLTAGGTGSPTNPTTAATTTPASTTTTVVTASIPTTVTPIPPTTTLAVGWNPEVQTVEYGYDGSVVMETSFLAPDGTLVGAGDTVAWQVHVTNTTDDGLWGVFAYVEGFGPAYCDTRHIEAGESTDCWAAGLAYAGVGDVVAWVNAWTEERQVKAIDLIPFTVAP